MRRRFFICGYYDFPRGSASANYIQYFTQLLLDLKYEVILLTNVDYEELKNQKTYFDEYKGQLTLCDMSSRKKSKSKLQRYMEVLYTQGADYKKALTEFGLTENDYVLVYDAYPAMHNAILSVARKYKAKTLACIVEWFPVEMYPHHIVNVDYWKTFLNFNYIFKKYDYLFPISHYIEAYLNKINCKKVMRLPVLCDPFEYGMKKKNLERIKIIYSGASRIKEDMDSFFMALRSLNEEQWEKLEIHISGIKYERIKHLFNDLMNEMIGENIVFHSWMSYRELVDLYKEMNYLIVPRKINQMTQANFPSKVPEAMCYGVVPVVTNVGDYTGIYLKDGLDSLVFGESSISTCESVINRILSINETEYQELSHNARKTAEDAFYYKKWEQKIKNFIEN